MFNPKVLVIDDEAAVTWAVLGALRREGYDLFFAENGKEGLSLARQLAPTVILL